MNDFAFTRCPGCRTVFRVTRAQLALREGQVRCGQCRAVFDANDHLVKSSPAVEPETEVVDVLPASDVITPPEEIEASPASEEGAATPPEAIAVSPASEETTATRPEETPGDDAPPPEATVPIEGALGRPRVDEWRPRRRLREQPKALYALAIVVLVGLLALQALLEFRDALAAHAPATRPVLETACRLAGCAVGPLRDAAALSIEASELSADPAHKGLLKLTATVRNRAAYPIAYPYLELTLTDASDAVVARRAFAPSTYATSADPSAIAGNGEVLVTMFFDASGTSQAGYRLYLFYP